MEIEIAEFIPSGVIEIASLRSQSQACLCVSARRQTRHPTRNIHWVLAR